MTRRSRLPVVLLGWGAVAVVAAAVLELVGVLEGLSGYLLILGSVLIALGLACLKWGSR